MQLIKELTRDEMRNVMAGSGSCRVKLHNADGTESWTTDCLNYYDAVSAYENNGEDNPQPDGSYVVAYCCESCGEEGFASAMPCMA